MMLRIENIADIFDTQTGSDLVFQKINLDAFVKGLFELVNPDNIDYTYEI